MRSPAAAKSAGFTFVEIAIGAAILTVLCAVAYAVLVTATTLLAKNLALNSSNTLLRAAFDRIHSEISQANGMPKLIDSGGNPVTGNGPAAGVVFDRYLGGPYVVTNPGKDGLPASATSFEIKFATDPLAAPPFPEAGDVVCIGNSSLRPIVSSSNPASLPPSPPAVQAVTVSLRQKLAQSIPWSKAVQETAYAVHRKAIVVVPTGSRKELRLYSNVETTSGSCDLTTPYVVLTREIGTKTGEDTPFALTTKSSVSFLSVSIKVETQQYNQVLASRQAKEFNTFLQVDGLVRPRNFL